jgi:hypothetical protein
VKLSIKSFKVPELFIEIPATATVGLLKVCDIACSLCFLNMLQHAFLPSFFLKKQANFRIYAEVW